MSQFEIDISSLKPGALVVVIAVLTRARLNREKRNHKLPLADFFREVGFGGEVRIPDFQRHVYEAMKVKVHRSDNNAEVWPFLDRARISKSIFDFAVNKFARDAGFFPASLAVICDELIGCWRPSV